MTESGIWSWTGGAQKKRRNPVMRFTEKVCLVTGGGSGIGRAACTQFAQEGGRGVVVDLNDQHGNETVRGITQAGGEAIFAKCDVGNPDEIKAAIKTTVDK